MGLLASTRNGVSTVSSQTECTTTRSTETHRRMIISTMLERFAKFAHQNQEATMCTADTQICVRANYRSIHGTSHHIVVNTFVLAQSVGGNARQTYVTMRRKTRPSRQIARDSSPLSHRDEPTTGTHVRH